MANEKNTKIPVLEGPFPLLVTPWTDDAKLDVETLVHEAEFVDRAGVGGMIWPTSGEVGQLDSTGEYEAGLRALATRAARGNCPFQARLTAVCMGATAADGLARVKKVEAICRATGAKMAILARPPDDAKDQAAIGAYYRQLARLTTLPVIIQTYNNGKSPQPDVELLAKLAAEFPLVFGYVKEESPGEQVNARMAALLAHREIKGVFSGWGGKGWVYQGTRIGTCGVISQRPAYAGLFARVWNRISAKVKANDTELANAYMKYLYMINLGDVFCKAGDDMMRGPHLYVLQRLGIFKNRLTRSGKAGEFKLENYEMSEAMKAEVDARLAFTGITAENPWGR